MAAGQLILKRSSLAHAAFDDYDVLFEGKHVGRIYHDNGTDQWFWGLAYGYHKDRTPTHHLTPSASQAAALAPSTAKGLAGNSLPIVVGSTA